jgi:ACR3 family arsenite transporter
MSAQCEITAKQKRGSKIGFFERYLTLWVFLCIITGIAFAPGELASICSNDGV